MTDHGTAMSSNGVSSPRSNGGLDIHSSENGVSGVNLGWQKVTNPKKYKRQELRSKGQSSGSLSDNVKRGPDNKVFQALEKDAEERRAHREALLQAAVDAAAKAANVQSDSDVEGDEDYQAEAHATSNGDLQKPKLKKPKKQKVSVVQAASAIDSSNLESFLTEISESFSELPDVQLMRFADYFGRVFSAVSPTQFGWNKILKESSVAKAVEIPLCYVPESVNKIASNWLATRPVDALGDFIVWGLNDVLNDVQQQQGTHKGSKGMFNNLSGKTKVAVLVVLALAIRKRPEALFQRAGTVGSSPQFQGHEKLPMLAWAYGQAAQGDLVVGMQLWVKNLLPVACGKISTPASRDITLQFAESILFANLKKTQPVLQNAASRKGERLVPPVALDSLMHAAYPSDVTRTKATERFLGIYPIVKELSLAGAHRSKATKAAAQQLLPLSLEAASEDIPALVHEACDISIWCLSQNTECFKQWEKLHLENLKGSVQLLSYACSEWTEIADRLSPLNDLRNTVNVLRVKNRAAVEKTKGDLKLDTLVKSADKHCKVLEKKLARVGICLKVAAVFITSVCTAYGLYLLNPGAKP